MNQGITHGPSTGAVLGAWPGKPRKLVIQPRLRTAVLRLLAHRWSAEQIARGLPDRRWFGF
jgi:hypothetical protein